MTAGKQTWLLAGVGGMGMLPLALLLREAGDEVVGVDDRLTERCRRMLDRAGVRLPDRFEPLPSGIDRAVFSSAVRPGHPLRERVTGAGIPWELRGECLARLTGERRLLAVVGSHGKTTTTAMIAHLARLDGPEVGYFIGGLPAGGEPPSRAGSGEWIVAEVDESDGTIDRFAPEVCLFLNFDWDHTDRYPTEEDLWSTLASLASRASGTVILPTTAGPWGRVADAARSHRVFAGAGSGINDLNRTAAEEAWAAIRGDPPAPSAWAGFSGVWRRQTVHRVDGRPWEVMEDYAHHPGEIERLLSSLRPERPGVRMSVLYQPHRYTRTRALAAGTARALAVADDLALLPVYGAGEAADPLGTSAVIARNLAGLGTAVAELSGGGEALGWIRGLGEARAADEPWLVVFLGAGDFNDGAPLAAARLAGLTPAAAMGVSRPAWLHPEAGWEEDASLAALTTLRTPGRAAVLVAPVNESDVVECVRRAGWLGMPVEVLGRGSNLLVDPRGFDGLVLRFSHPNWRRFRDLGGGRLLAGPGLSLQDLARRAAEAGIAGFSFAEGIPGSVGGGIRMNAGAMGAWMSERLESVVVCGPDGRVGELAPAEVGAGYRTTRGLENRIVLAAVFRGVGRADPSALREEMRGFAAERRSRQPGGPSAGCMFRNPEGDAAGRLIDAAGCKGWTEGAMEVSDRHANFFLNRGGASGEDVIRLIRRVRERVRDFHGVELEPEVRVLGRDWNEIFSEFSPDD